MSSATTTGQGVVPDQPNRMFAFFIAFVAATGGFLFGYDLNIITGGNMYIRDFFHLGDRGFGFATSSAMVGCFAGPVLGFKFCDWIGRKNTLILSGILFAVSAVFSALAPNIWIYNIFRIVGGVGIGLSSIASPMYIAEVAPARMRGQMGIMYQLAIAVGSTIAALIGFLIAGSWFPGAECWRWMLASEIVAIVVFLLFLFFVPKSPRWLAQKGRFEEARKILAKIDGAAYADVEITEIKAQLNEETGSFREIFFSGLFMALIIALLLAIFNNWNGWTAMAYYLPVLFKESGVTDYAETIKLYTYVNIWMVGMTALAIVFVDRIGRRKLWNFGSVAMIVVMLLAAYAMHQGLGFKAMFVVACICGFPHALALGPIPWFMMSELFPTRVRAKAVMISTTVIWIAGFTAAYFMPGLMSLSKAIVGSLALTFVLFAVINVFGLIFGLKMLPETKGRTLEEIARSWMKKKS